MTLSVDVRHRLGSFTLEAAFASAGGITAVFGASGCGKTSLVNIIAGLIRPNFARISVGDTVLVDTARGIDVPPHQRRIGYVFQEARLFPHMTVESNLAYGEWFTPKAQRYAARAQILDLLGIAHLLRRRPRDLSGGEKQRVAIGRALLASPRLLLMDEPLASLDAPRKAEILPYLLRLKSALGLPILYVTHATEEMQTIADTLVLLESGRTIAAGPVEALTARGDLPLARRDDAGAVLTAQLLDHLPERGLSRVQAGDAVLQVPLVEAAPGARLRLHIPAREIILATEAPRGISLHNMVPCTIHAIGPGATPHLAMVEMAAGEARLLASVTADAVRRLGLAPGGTVLALIKAVAVEVRRTD